MPLTDDDTRVVAARVLVEIDRRKHRRIVTAMAVLSAMFSMLAYIVTQVQGTRENRENQQEDIEVVAEQIDELAQRPYVERLATNFSEAARLVIIGNAFGSDAGTVELFYMVNPDVEELMGEESTGEMQTQTLYLRDESIEQWTDDRIIVSTTEQERQSLLEHVGKCDFESMIPLSGSREQTGSAAEFGDPRFRMGGRKPTASSPW